MFSFKSNVLFAQFRVLPLTISLKQQQFALIVIILCTSFAYTITIVIRSSNHNYSLHKQCVSSHKTDWILSESPLLTLSCLLYCRPETLMNAFGEECLRFSKFAINVNKLLAVLLLLVYLFIRFFYTALCCCLFTF